MADSDCILALLYDRGEGFFLLDELAAAAGLSAAGVGAAIDALRDGGYHLEHNPAHGVRLVGPVRPSAHLIERGMAGRRIGRSVICFDEVASTSDVAMDSARQGDTDGLVVLAESQTLGRGRQGRRWHSDSGANILMSVLLLESAATPPCHEALTIAAGLAVAEGLEAALGLHPALKWPNDVLLDGRKVAGILVEVRPAGAMRAVVIGVGINANASPADDMVDLAATNLATCSGGAVDRTEVILAVLRRLDQRAADVSAGVAEEEDKELHDSWLGRCGMINQRITVISGGHKYVGRVLDVSPMKGLVLCCDDGRQVILPAESSTISRCT